MEDVVLCLIFIQFYLIRIFHKSISIIIPLLLRYSYCISVSLRYRFLHVLSIIINVIVNTIDVIPLPESFPSSLIGNTLAVANLN